MENGAETKPKYQLLIVLPGAFLSVLLSRIGFGFFLFPLPILTATYRLRNQVLRIVAQAVTFLIVILMQIITLLRLRGTLLSDYCYVGIVFVISVSLIALIYSSLRNFSSAVLRRIVFACIPVIILACISLFRITSLNFEAASEYFEAVFAEVFKILNTNTETFMYMVRMTVNYGLIPVCLFFGILNIFLSENICNRFNNQWKEEFALMKMPRHYLWFLAVLVLFLVVSMIFNLPEIVKIITVNLFSSFSMFYVINGISVFYSRVRKKKNNTSVGLFLLIFFIFLFIPFAGTVVLLLCLLTGVFEGILENRLVLR